MRQVRDAQRTVTLNEYLTPTELGDSRMPSHTVLEEKPQHRAIAYLLSAGRTRAEVSEITGIGISTLSNLVRQPWFKTRLKEISDLAGKDMVKAFLEGEVLPSLEVLREMRDDERQKGPTRIAASVALLDRFLGKPVAHIESTSTLNIHTASQAATTVEAELAKIDAELKARGVRMVTNSTS